MFLHEEAGLRKEPRGKLVGVISQAIGVRRNNILITNAYRQDIQVLLLELNDEGALSIFCSRAATSDLTIAIPI